MDVSLNEFTWSKKIKTLRQIKGWTQKETAKKCRTNQKVYWSWENGKNYPRKNSQFAISRAFNVEVEDIFPI